MNIKEVGEIRRHIRRDRSNMTAIYGCYINEKREIRSEFRQSTGMMSENEGEKYFGLLKRSLSGSLGKNLIDINFRTDIFRDKQAALKVYGEMIKLADIVKFSEDEVEIFGEAFIEENLSDKLVCITLGKAGSEWRYRGKRGVAPSVSVKPVDTTGAGDTFNGVLAACLADGVGIEAACEKANIAAAIKVSRKYILDSIPFQKEIETYKE